MRAIYKHEMASFFTSWVGYVFIAILLLFAGIFMSAVCLTTGNTHFEYVLGNMTFVYIVAVPVITMRVFSGERRQRTDQLLFSLPVSSTKIVLGKYLALITLLAIPMAVILFYPPILMLYGIINILPAYASIVAFYFLGAALLAVGMFISSLTESQVLSVGITLAALLLNFFLASLANYAGTAPFVSFVGFLVAAAAVTLIVFLMTKHWLVTLITGVILFGVVISTYVYNSTMYTNLLSKFLEGCSLFYRFDSFMYGTFRFEHILCYVSVAGIFVFLTVQSLEKRRWSA